MSGQLERDFRSSARWYPKRWRESNEDALVGALLDVAEGTGRTRITLAERADLASNGFAMRMNLVIPDGVRSGIASIALGTGTALSLVFFLLVGWAPWTTIASRTMGFTHFGPFMNPGVLVYGLWLLAAILAFANQYRQTRMVLALAFLVGLALPLVNGTFGWNGPRSTTLAFLGVLALMAMSGTPRNRPHLAIALSLWTGLFVLAFAVPGGLTRVYRGDEFFWTIPAGTVMILLGVVTVVLIALGLRLAGFVRACAVILISLIPWALVFAAREHINTTNQASGELITIAGAVIVVASATFAIRHWANGRRKHASSTPIARR
jgi:hypothetical protein